MNSVLCFRNAPRKLRFLQDDDTVRFHVDQNDPRMLERNTIVSGAVVLLFMFMSQSSTEKIVQALERWIKGARVGQKLPTSRELMLEHGVGPGTVRNAIHDLSRRGLVETRVGVGVFVARQRLRQRVDFSWQTSALGASPADLPAVSATQKLASPDALAFNSGYPAESLLPGDLIRRAVVRAGKTSHAVERSAVQGNAGLREWFAGEIDCDTRDVVVVPGTQSGLNAIVRAVVGSRRPLIVEAPTYWGMILAAKQASVRLYPVASDSEGPSADELDRAFRRTGAIAFYGQPAFANPHGRSWSSARRAEIMEVVDKHNAFLIEDDWAHDFWINRERRPMAADDSLGRVVYLRSLTKSVSPAIRVGAVIARGPVLDRISAHMAAENMYTSGLLQEVALEVVSSAAWQRHLAGVRKELAYRRDALIDALDRHAPDVHVSAVPEGGLNLWCEVDSRINVEVLARDCEGRGVLISAGNEWFPAESPGAFVRLNYAGESAQQYVKAAKVIQKSIEAIGN